MDHERTIFGLWWLWVLLLFGFSVVVLTILSYFGLIGGTIVEREVFKNSFQYSEARKSEIAVYEAQLSEIEIKVSNPSIDKNTRINMEALAASIRIQLNSARRK